MKGRVLALVVLLVAVVMFVWGGAVVQIPRDVLIIGRDTGDAVSLDPAQAFEFTSVWAVDQVYETLVNFSRDLSRAEPGLAESWTFSPDGKTWTFKLRKGAKFHSGNEVDADAVVFSLQRAFKLELEPSFIITMFIDKPEDIKALNKDTVEITFKQTMPEVLMTSVLSNPVTAVVDPQVVQAHATVDDPWANKWLSDHDAGAGPFILQKWERNVEIVLEAFPEYYGGKPFFSRIIIKDIPEPTDQLLLLKKGDIDVAMDLLPEQITEVKAIPEIVVSEKPAFQVRYIGMNVSFEPLSHEEVRDAIRFAIDYEAIAKEIMKGAVQIGQTIVPAGMFAHLPATPYYRDIEYAKALMKKAGYENGFKVELMIAPVPPSPDQAAKIKEDLAAINIDVEIKQVLAAQLYETYRAQKHQMVLALWGADYPDPDNLAKAFGDFDAKQLAYRNVWKNDRVSALVKQAVIELDPVKRETLYHEIQMIILDEGPYVVLYYPLNQIAMRSNVLGLEASSLFATTDLSLASKR
jgi:peptide/nickel transport system substrate-binding protein